MTQTTLEFNRTPQTQPPPPVPAPLKAVIASALFRRVARQTGIRVELPDGTWFGTADGPRFRIHRPEDFFARVGRDGKIGFGEAYMAGDWDAPGDLAELLEPLARSIRTLVPPRLQGLRRYYEPRPPDHEENDPTGSRRNIARHYDLSNEFFALFLDPTMTYSSALFQQPSETLEQAQVRKIDRLLDTAGVTAGSRILEIGTGWGELAIRAARRGAHVTTLTLSREQAALARARVASEGLTGSVDVREDDYRQSTGRFDAVISVEMIEAVGERWWPMYFRTLEQRLVPGGRAAIQTILMDHDSMTATRRSWTWVHKYIFPGGIIPSLEAIEQTLSRHTSLHIHDRYHFGRSYAETLRRWRATFHREAGAVSSLGFDDVFQRMWDFYLAYSEAGFRSGYLDVAQLVLTR